MWWIIIASWLIVGLIVARCLGRRIDRADAQARAALQSAIARRVGQRSRDAESND